MSNRYIYIKLIYIIAQYILSAELSGYKKTRVRVVLRSEN
jgi:hypothetical protein